MIVVLVSILEALHNVAQRITNNNVVKICTDVTVFAVVDNGIILPYPTVLCVTNEK